MTTMLEHATVGQEMVGFEPAWNEDGLPLPPDPRASLDRALRMAWRRRWLFLLVFTPILLTGFGYLVVAPERYTAHALLMVGFRQPELLTAEQAREPVRGEPDMDGAIELIQSQQALTQVARTLELDRRPDFQSLTQRGRVPILTRVRQFVATRLGLSWVERQPHDLSDLVASRLRKDIRVDRVGHSSLLDVAYSSADPALAASVANALANFSAEDESFLARVTLAERSGFQIIKTSVVSSAVPPSDPSSPNTMLILAGTLACAFATALSAMLLKEYRALQTVLSTEEIMRRGHRSLGLIPFNRALAGRRGPRTVMVDPQRGHALVDSVTSLQVTISTLVPGHNLGCPVLLFTSALRAEGKSTTAAVLGASMAASGARVLLIDADLRSPTLHRAFDLERLPGLADCINPSIRPGDLIQHDPVTGVHLVAAGEYHKRPLQVLGSSRLRYMINSWRAEYDVILIDSPPVLAVSDARILAQTADFSIVVARWGKTSWRTLNHALRLLADGGARIAGVTVSRVNVKEFATYDYADARIYGPAYGSQTRARRN